MFHAIHILITSATFIFFILLRFQLIQLDSKKYGYWIFGLSSFVFLLILVISYNKNVLIKCVCNVTIIIGIAVYVKLLQKSKFYVPRNEYGPIFLAYNNETLVHWYTRQRCMTCLNVDRNENSFQNYASQLQKKAAKQKTNFHNVLVQQQNFTIINFSYCSNFTNNNQNNPNFSHETPQIINKIVIISDIHANNKYVKRIPQSAQLILVAGDISQNGKATDFAEAFHQFPQTPLVVAVGNHDTRMSTINKILQRKFYYYQKVGNVGIFVLFAFMGYPGAERHSKKAIDEQFLWLENIIDTNDEHKFILTHAPVYSTGLFGSTPYFTHKMEDFLDRYQTARIRAVFQGHDHVFAAFRRKNVMIFTAATFGGYLDPPQKSKFKTTRWSAKSLHGPLISDNNKRIGYNFHLDSWLINCYLELDIGEGNLVYKVFNLDSGKIIKQYVQSVE